MWLKAIQLFSGFLKKFFLGNMIFSWMNKSGMPSCHIQHLSGVYWCGAQWTGVEGRAAWKWVLECSWQDTLLVNFPMCRCKAWCYSDRKVMKSASSIKFMPSFTEKRGGIGWDELYATRRLWSYKVPKKCIWSKVVIISNLKCTMAMLTNCYIPHVCVHSERIQGKLTIPKAL